MFEYHYLVGLCPKNETLRHSILARKECLLSSQKAVGSPGCIWVPGVQQAPVLLGNNKATAEQWICPADPHCMPKPTPCLGAKRLFFCPATRTTCTAQSLSDVRSLFKEGWTAQRSSKILNRSMPSFYVFVTFFFKYKSLNSL